MADTTAVNNGREKGICSRMTLCVNETYGHDVLALECLYYSIELYLNDITTAYDENTKISNKLVEESEFNLISGIKRDLSRISDSSTLKPGHWHKI